MDIILRKLFKKKTIKRLKQEAKKFVAGVTIIMSVFYGTLYYALITLASEDDNVPKPLVNQIGDPASNPHKFYLESIENIAGKISGLASEGYENYKGFTINGRKIIEPTPVLVKNKLYVPFRLLIASGSSDYEAELKSKKGTQKISLAGDKFEYSIFEKQANAPTNSASESNKKKGFLKLATIKPEFQVKHYKSAETPTPLPEISITSPSFDVPTPQLSPDWQNIPLANPVSTSWSIYDNFIEIKQASDFVFEEKNYSAWLKIKLGFDGSDYINSWDLGISGEENITSDIEFKVRLRVDLAGKISRKANESGNLEVEIEKKRDELATDVFDLEENLDGESDEPKQENTAVPEITPEPIVDESAPPTPNPSVLPTPTSAVPTEIETSPIPTESEATESPVPTPELLPSAEPSSTPHLEITPTPVETPIESPAPEPTFIPLPETTDGQAEPIPTPEPIQAEPSPTSLLNKLFGINSVNAEEVKVIEQPSVEPTVESKPPAEPEPLPVNSEEPGNLVVELLSNDGGANEETIPEVTQIPEPATDSIIDGASNLINQITEGLTGFVESASVSAPTIIDLEVQPPSEEVEPINESLSSEQPEEIDLSEPPQDSRPLLAQIADALSGLNVFSDTELVISELNFGLGEEGNVNLQLNEKSRTLITEKILKPEAETTAKSTTLSTSNVDNSAKTVLATISDIGVVVNSVGIWVSSGDGNKSTDFKIHFNPQYGGAIDRLYLGTDFTINKVAKPQAGSGGLTMLEQDKYSQTETRSSTLEVIEQSKVRIVIDNIFKLGPEASVAERWSIYATGRIIKRIIYDKYKTGEERWFLNAAKTGYDLPAGYNKTQLILNTKVEPNSKDLMLVWQDPVSLASSSFEAGETDNSYTTVAKLTREPWTYTEYQMIDLMQENLSMVDKTAIDERTTDYRNPDKPEFALGRYIQFNKQYASYEMESAANQNRVIFTLDGSQTPRFQPVFEIHDWENPDLNGVKAFLNQKNMVENRDYIVDFRNGNPSTGILVFHFLGTLRVNSEFSADGFGVFDIDPEVAPGGGILMYADTSEVSRSTVTTDSTGNVFGAFTAETTGTVRPLWVINRANPVGSALASGSDNEHLVGNLDTTGKFELLRWDGTVWSLEWTENEVSSTSLDTRGFDIAYENSGEAVVAWGKSGDDTGIIEYRVWNGVSWGASTSFVIPTALKVSWIEMASHPASGSNQNEIGLCYVTGGASGTSGSTGTRVGCAVWNGVANTWGNATEFESNADEYIKPGSSKGVSTFYEQSSGELVAIWGPEHSGNDNTTAPELVYVSWDGSSWTATAGFDAAAAGADGASTLVCAPAPFSLNGTTTKNKAVCVADHAAVSDTWSFIWSGSAPGNANLNTEPTNNQVDGILTQVAAAWIIDTRAMGLIVFGTADGTALDYEYWDDTAAAWTVDQTLTHTTSNDRNYVIVSNPYLKNTATIFLVDAASDLYAYEASVSGTTVTAATMNGGVAINQNLPSPNFLSVGMAYDLFPNPTQTHYQWLNDSGALNNGTAAASQDTALTGLAQSTVKRLRVQISNEGTASKSSNFQLEFAKKGASCAESGLSAGWDYREIHTDAVTASDAFDIELTANFANGDATTASLSAEDPTFVAGQGIESASSTSAITLTGNNYTDIEYSLQANTNAQATTDYCFRLTDGGASTSFTYTRYAEVQTGEAAVTAPTYTQDYFRFYVNVNDISPTDPWPSSGGADLAENATMSAHFASVASGSITRLRTNVLVSTATLNAASQTFQFQYAQGFKCGAIAGGSWAAVGASTSDTIWRFGSNVGVTDGTALPDGGTLLSNSTNAARATYEEGNPSAVNPNAVTSGQRMEHDWSLQNNGATAGASYCFRIIRPSGTVFETYNYFPLVVLAPSTDQVLRHGAFFSEGYEQGYYWSGL